MSIEAMKQALQALEFFCEYGVIDRPFERIAELKQAIAEAEKQEPVDETVKSEHEVEFREYLTRLNWQQGFERGWDDAVEKLSLTQEKLGYTAPPKREWVGLTDEERENWKALGLVGVEIVAAHLKEKNGG